MEIMNAPIIIISNQNENLIFPSEENGQLNTNVNQYFDEKKINHLWKMRHLISDFFIVI